MPAQPDDTDDDPPRRGDGHGAPGPADPPRQSRPAPTGFGWRGWVLVGVLVGSLIVVPTAILFLPAAQGVIRSLGLTLRDAYLTLPLLPALVLGATAVWVALRSRAE
jgi:hypothetical protein